MSSPIDNSFKNLSVRFDETPSPASFKKRCLVCGKMSHRIIKVIQRDDGNSYICTARCLEVFHNRLSPQRPLFLRQKF